MKKIISIVFISCMSFVILAADVQLKRTKTDLGRSEILNPIKSNLNQLQTLTHHDLLQTCLKHESEQLRWDTCALLLQIMKKKASPLPLRQEITETYCHKLNHDSSNRLKQSLLRWLFTFNENDFNTRSKKLVVEYHEQMQNKSSILLMGVANIDDDSIEKLAQQEIVEPKSGKYYGTTIWAAHLYMGRRHHLQSIEAILSTVSKEKKPVIKYSTLLKELSYIKDARVVDYLKNILNDDQGRLPKLKSTVPGTRYAQWAAFILAGMLEDFPVQKNSTHFSTEELQTCRAWMENQSEYRFR